MPAIWGRVPVWWAQRLREKRAGVVARDILIVLAAHAGKPKGDHPGQAWPSIEQIAKTLSISTRYVKKGIEELRVAGIVRTTPRNRRKRESNLYELAIDGEPFQVNESFTQNESDSGEPIVQVIRAESERLGEQIEPDQVNTLSKNQFPDRCSKASENLSREPTMKPSVLTSFARPDSLRSPGHPKKDDNDDEDHDQRDLEKLTRLLTTIANGNEELGKQEASSEAKRLLSRWTRGYERERLAGHLSHAIGDRNLAGFATKVAWAERQTQRGEDPSTLKEVA
jgi:hypothetical protein